jgi:hypothetical protein
MFVLRPDLHNELKRLALDEEDKTPLPELILGTKVVGVVRYMKALDMSLELTRPQ